MLVSSSSESACNASFWQGRLVQFRLRSIGCLCVAILEFHVLWAMRGRRRWKRVGSAAGTPTPGLAARSTAPEAWHANRCIVASPRSTSFPKMSQVHAGERNFADICRQARRRASPMLLLPRWVFHCVKRLLVLQVQVPSSDILARQIGLCSRCEYQACSFQQEHSEPFCGL